MRHTLPTLLPVGLTAPLAEVQTDPHTPLAAGSGTGPRMHPPIVETKRSVVRRVASRS